jgi:hypothetical protein
MAVVRVRVACGSHDECTDSNRYTSMLWLSLDNSLSSPCALARMACNGCMRIELPPELEGLVESKVADGTYETTHAVVRSESGRSRGSGIWMKAASRPCQSMISNGLHESAFSSDSCVQTLGEGDTGP